MVKGKCYDIKRCNDIKAKRKEHLNKYYYIWQSKLESFFSDCQKGNAKIILDKHFYKRSYQRVINENDLITVIENGEVIEQSRIGGVVRLVVFSYVKAAKSIYRPVHVVLEVVNRELWSVITAYSPSSHSWKWNNTYDERICFCKNDEGSN